MIKSYYSLFLIAIVVFGNPQQFFHEHLRNSGVINKPFSHHCISCMQWFPMFNMPQFISRPNIIYRALKLINRIPSILKPTFDTCVWWQIGKVIQLFSGHKHLPIIQIPHLSGHKHLLSIKILHLNERNHYATQSSRTMP